MTSCDKGPIDVTGSDKGPISMTGCDKDSFYRHNMVKSRFLPWFGVMKFRGVTDKAL